MRLQPLLPEQATSRDLHAFLALLRLDSASEELLDECEGIHRICRAPLNSDEQRSGPTQCMWGLGMFTSELPEAPGYVG